MKRLGIYLLGLTWIFTLFGGCTAANTGTDSSSRSGDSSVSSKADTSSAAPVSVDFAASDADRFTDRDYDAGYTASGSVNIQLNGSSATANSDSVRIAGSTITLTQEATYILSGTLEDGMIIVDAPDTAKLQLVLNGVHLNSSTSAPLYILKADKVFVTLAQGTANTLSNGGTFTAIDETNIDAALFSKQDLTLNGTGRLTVTSPAGHGIVCKDDLVITGGTYTIHAASHGLDANDSVRITGAAITIDAGKDAIHAENNDDASLGFIYISGGTLKLAAEGDGISAGSYMQIADGIFEIAAGGGSENGTKQSSDSWGGFMGGRPGQSVQASSSDDSSTSMKGLKAASGMLISAGTIAINSADDSVHSNASITINGGSFEIASGDDGFHADETLTITSGTVQITESYEGLEALDVVVSGGDIRLSATDDGINAAGGTDFSGTGGRGGDMFGHRGPGGMEGGMSSPNGSIVISGGNIYIQASGDGIDANGSLTISGGSVTVCGPTQGDTATLDYDTTGVITGGTFIGTGAAGMAQSFSDAEQGVVAVRVGNQTAETTVTLKDSNGSTLLSCTPELDFAIVILSSPDIVAGNTYTLLVGDTSTEVEAG